MGTISINFDNFASAMSNETPIELGLKEGEKFINEKDQIPNQASCQNCNRKNLKIYLQYIILVGLMVTTIYSVGFTIVKTSLGQNISKPEYDAMATLLNSLANLQSVVGMIQPVAYKFDNENTKFPSHLVFLNLSRAINSQIENYSRYFENGTNFERNL